MPSSTPSYVPRTSNPLGRALANPHLQLLHGVFEECNISFSKALCNKLAQRISSTGIGKYPESILDTPTQCASK